MVNLFVFNNYSIIILIAMKRQLLHNQNKKLMVFFLTKFLFRKKGYGNNESEAKGNSIKNYLEILL